MKASLHTIALLLLVATLSLTSCNKKKRLEKSKRNVKTEVELLEEKMTNNFLEVEWLSAKTKISTNDGKKKLSFNADIRMRKDSVCWMMIYPPIVKIALAQVLITSDSVKVIDRMNKKYYAKSIDYIEDFTNYPLDFNTLQNLILGQPIANTNKDSKIEATADGNYSINTLNQQLAYLLKVEGQSYTISNMNISDAEKNRHIQVDLSNYETINNKAFAHKRTIAIQAPEEYEAEIDFSRVKVNEKQKFPFKVSKKYTRVE